MKAKDEVIVFLIIFLAVSLASCSVFTNLFDVTYDVSAYFKKASPKIVAILPFENFSDNPEASDVLRKIFYAQFSPKKFIDVEIFKVDSELKKNRIKNPSPLRSPHPEEIGKMLEADALIYGKVTYYKKKWMFFYASKTVGLFVEMKDTRTGKTLWAAEHKITTYGGTFPGITYSNMITTVLSLATGPVTSLWNYYLNEAEFARNANELCMKIVETIP